MFPTKSDSRLADRSEGSPENDGKSRRSLGQKMSEIRCVHCQAPLQFPLFLVKAPLGVHFNKTHPLLSRYRDPRQVVAFSAWRRFKETPERVLSR